MAERVSPDVFGGAGAPGKIGGWTIVELAIVMTVFSMMLAYAMPFAGTMLANGKVRSTAEALQGGLAIAQAEALRRSTRVELLLVSGEPAPFNAGANAVASGFNWLVRIPADVTRGTTAIGFVRGSSSATPSGAATMTNQGGAIGVGYNANGRLTLSANGVNAAPNQPIVFRIDASGSDRPLCVYSTITGTVKTCDPMLAGSDFRSCQPALPAGMCVPVSASGSGG